MTILRTVKKGGYTSIDNAALRDPRLSAKATGVLAVLLSFSDTWDFNQQGLLGFFSDGIDAIRAALHELEEAGYLTRTRERDEDGKLGASVWIVREVPGESGEPMLENPIQVEPTLRINKGKNNQSVEGKKIQKESREESHKHGAFGNVLLTDTELSKLKERFPSDWQTRIDDLSYYIGSTGKRYKSHFRTILAWDRKNSPKGVDDGRYAKYAD